MVGAAEQSSVGSLNRSIALSSLIRARYSSGRVNMPLQGSVNYMRLKHVQGVPSPGGEGQGFTLSRLRMLDTMIERLESAANRSEGQNPVERAAEALYRRLADMGTSSGTGFSGAEPGTFLNLLV